MQIFKNDWQNFLPQEMQKPYYQKLRQFLIEEYRHRTIFPDMYDIFNALHYTSYEDVKAVILGQDPYHEEGEAHGLSFSVQKGVKIPPSLENIFKELHSDLGIKIPKHGNLEPWAREGVLLLNSVLTVRCHAANSHKNQGWEIFTDQIITFLNERPRPIAFILWGSAARRKKALISGKRHLILESPHPSPLSAHRGFFGMRPFSKVNEFLVKNGEKPLSWRLDD